MTSPLYCEVFCMSNIHTLPGRKFGTLTVVRRARNERGNQARFICICDCGKEQIRLARDLLTGTFAPCECAKLSEPAAAAPKPQHGKKSKAR